jgi:transcriptional regulator with XRE-family HTH domain
MKHRARIELERAFGKAMRKFRLELGVSQEKLAELADLHRTYVGDVERGERNISLLNMWKIARALRVRLSDLVREMEKLVAK